MQISIAEAAEILRARLAGSFISRFSVGDTWELDFGDCWLVAQEVVTEDEAALSRFLAAESRWYAGAVDKDTISKSAFVAACMRKEVRGVSLDKACTLSLKFADGSTLLIPTNVEIVDWQWGITTSGANPYTGYLVACFWAGEMEASENEWPGLTPTR